MYKYLTITSNMQEMMVMLKSLPVCATVLNKNGQLIDINQPALDLLKIKAIEDYKTRRLKILNDYNYLLAIIQELKTGKIIRNKVYQLKYPDSDSVLISFSACMLNGLQNVFLFQFFELSSLSEIPKPKQTQKGSKVLQNINLIQENRHKSDMHELFVDQAIKNHMFKKYLDEDKIDILSRKYPFLMYPELIICGLIALRLSTDEIATLTGKSLNSIYVLKNKIFKKFDLSSSKELSKMLLNESKPVY